ncbi:MAG: pilin [Patescibacteria group bacterium]|nr:pilin [Patescibacteria group bacterium]
MKDCKEKVDSGASAKLENPLKGVTSVQQFIGLIIRAALGIVGSLALLMVIYGGFLLMTAHGNEQQVTKGKDVLIWAVLGLIIIFTSYAVVKNILDILK